MFRRFVYVLVLAALVTGIAGPAEAGVPATLILVSGDHVQGVLVDMGGVDFTMMEGGKEVRLPLANVAVIDFVTNGQGIPAAETAKIQAGRHLIVRRDGSVVYGRVADLGGTSPLRFTINSADGSIELYSNDIARIYFRQYQGMPVVAPTPAPAPAPPPAPTPAPRPAPRPRTTPRPNK